MDEVTLDTLLLSGECDVQWGSRGTLTVRRTVELHSNNVLYCFEEPKNSMAKHIREKVYVEGCHVVDGGAYNDASERLLLFLANHDYSEKVDLLGNHQAYIFAAEQTTHNALLGKATQSASTSTLPNANYVVQLFLSDKMVKWRLLQAIQRASKEYPQLFPDRDTTLALSTARKVGVVSVHAGLPTVAGSPVSGVANGFESKVLSQPSANPHHPRTESGISVLSDHEVLQLSDVLREYEALQERKRRLGTMMTSPPPQPKGEEEGVRKSTSDDQGLEAAACVAGNEARLAVALSELQSRAPAHLQHSPLYEWCIKSKPVNQICADCGEPFPSWCILQPFGAFVCIQCIGVHRKLWSNKCRSAELDRWPDSDIEFMKARGNDVVNDELEYYVALPTDSVVFTLHTQPAVKPVLSFSSAEVRESFIRWKYEELFFTRRRHPTATRTLPPPPDPVGLERSRLPTTNATSEAEGNASDVSFGATACLQQQSFFLDQGPPRYAGLLDIVVKELVGPESIAGAVCVLTNGFQTLRTQESRQLLHMRHSTAWDEHLQVGIEGTGQKPLYCTVYRGRGELLAAAEMWMQEDVFQPGTSCMFASKLVWNQLQKKPSQRTAGEPWTITFLTSYQRLA
ncbi:putative GTP-ase activating protein [Leishmania mexicana MHOM/GT/2001/U1103]|uniref:GTP-ase activating protein n=1 Tax=Leishmania mexicana (strain MHOM/GT/2001/U1103) TaxID=929439 RepID=E9B5R4_LEIMU|nr:putative GTP-ase activating protein [Leishmania mexicana MHOM/GT/2001/U1103]CBZ30584.1 putative GTP-ase activating protein [Leishmania mexicana MHOM/GT/2001/U1103]